METWMDTAELRKSYLLSTGYITITTCGIVVLILISQKKTLLFSINNNDIL